MAQQGKEPSSEEPPRYVRIGNALLAITEDVWLALAGEDEVLQPRPTDDHASFAPTGGAWSAVVTVSGEWQGMVTVELDETAARLLSARMLDLPEDATADGDVADAVGELVNMVGGGIKSLMPGPSALSLPAVAAGRAAFPSDVTELCRLDLLWRDAALRVSIHTP